MSHVSSGTDTEPSSFQSSEEDLTLAWRLRVVMGECADLRARGANMPPALASSYARCMSDFAEPPPAPPWKVQEDPETGFGAATNRRRTDRADQRVHRKNS